jgi:hypothetical protein
MPIKVFSVSFLTFGTEMQTSNPFPAALPSAMTSLSLSLSLSLSHDIDSLK